MDWVNAWTGDPSTLPMSAKVTRRVDGSAVHAR